MEVRGILLAAGRSIRMGRDKTALTLDGESLVERHVRQLRGAGIEDLIAVCNPDNQRAISMQVPSVLQCGDGMSGAVLTGLESSPQHDCLWLVCVNDVVPDADYQRMASRTATPGSILIATRVLEHTFDGGMLTLQPDSLRVDAITEKPPGGCPPGSSANIMIHRISGAAVLASLRQDLTAGIDYESAVNRLIAKGIAAWAVPMNFWIAIKTPEDYRRAMALLQ